MCYTVTTLLWLTGRVAGARWSGVENGPFSLAIHSHLARRSPATTHFLEWVHRFFTSSNHSWSREVLLPSFTAHYWTLVTRKKNGLYVCNVCDPLSPQEITGITQSLQEYSIPCIYEESTAATAVTATTKLDEPLTRNRFFLLIHQSRWVQSDCE